MWSVALDTTSHEGSVALIKNSSLVEVRSWARLHSHGEVLLNEFDSLCRKHNVSPLQLKRIFVGIGPGSFTGIRVGINFARSLSFAHNIPVVPMNSLELMGWQLDTHEFPMACVQYGFRNLLYCATYRLDQSRVIEIRPPSAITVEEFCMQMQGPQIIVGSGFPFIESFIDRSQTPLLKRSTHYLDFPSSSFFAKALSSSNFLAKEVPWTEVEPLYIRASEAEEKLKKSTL